MKSETTWEKSVSSPKSSVRSAIMTTTKTSTASDGVPKPRPRAAPGPSGSAATLPTEPVEFETSEEEGADVSSEETPTKKRRMRAPTGDYYPDRIVLTIEEAARAMNVSPFTMERAVRERQVRVSELTPQILRILPSELLDWAIRTRRTLAGEDTVPGSSK